jgi:ABC-type transporter Mla MlaB component
MRKVLLDLLKEKRAPRVIVNLQDVRYIDSACVASLVEGLKVLRDLKSGFAIYGLSRTTRAVRRQLTEEVEQQTSEWIWVTTLPAAQLCTEWAVRLGHQRWDIENHGFKELVQGWHADHVYKHDAQAIQAFLLMTLLAYNLHHAFLRVNLKPQIRMRKPQVFWMHLIAAEFYAEAGRFFEGPSP